MFLLTALGASAANGQTTLSIQPSSITLGAGETTVVEVNASNIPASGLAAFQFDVVFDPAVLDVVNVNEAFRGSGVPPFAPLGNDGSCDAVRGTTPCPDPDWLLITTGRTPVGTDMIDNGIGFVQVAYGTSGAAAPPVDGGTIALLQVTAHTADPASLSMTNVILADNQEPPQGFTPVVAGAAVNGGPTLRGAVALQGRPAPPAPRWSVPLDVALFNPADGTPAFACTPVSNESGLFQCSGLSAGDYVACVKHAHTLRNCTAVTLGTGQTDVDFGTLREGDANDDNCVLLVDFSILATSFARCSGDAAFDVRADFDGSGCVLLVDFSLLATSFGTCGDTPPPTGP